MTVFITKLTSPIDLLEIENCKKSLVIDSYIDSYWSGDGLAHFGIKDGEKVDKEDVRFQRLFFAVHPKTQESLRHLKQLGKSNKSAIYAWGVVFFAPRDLCILYSIGNDKTQKIILDIHKKSVRESQRWIEKNNSYIRRYSGGRKIEKAKIVFANFTDLSNSNTGLKLKTFSILPNLGVSESGLVRTLADARILIVYHEASNVYERSLKRELESRLGFNVSIERERNDESFSLSNRIVKSEFLSSSSISPFCIKEIENYSLFSDAFSMNSN